jgi:hypothetical protein
LVGKATVVAAKGESRIHWNYIEHWGVSMNSEGGKPYDVST